MLSVSIAPIDRDTSSVGSCSSHNSGKKRSRTPLSQSLIYDKLNENTLALLRSIHPSAYAKAAFKANGFGDVEAIAINAEKRLVEPTEAMLNAYGTQILNAVRSNDLPLAKSLYKDGLFEHGCNACNRFGESILHIACRRGHLDMVRFLIEEVGLSVVNIRDDYHRTPLHDAFWTSTARFDVVDYLLKVPHVTELLMCKDKRGFTPLDYSRAEDHGKWLRFLWERRAELKPTEFSKEEEVDEDDEISLSLLLDFESAKDDFTHSFKRQKIIG